MGRLPPLPLTGVGTGQAVGAQHVAPSSRTAGGPSGDYTPRRSSFRRKPESRAIRAPGPVIPAQAGIHPAHPCILQILMQTKNLPL